jgi:hypothetical protein
MAEKLKGWAGLAGMTNEMNQYDTPLKNHKLGVGLLHLMKAMGSGQANSIFGGVFPQGWIPDFNAPPGGGNSGGGGTGGGGTGGGGTGGGGASSWQYPGLLNAPYTTTNWFGKR